MDLELQRANTLAVPAAPRAAMPTGGSPADRAADPADGEREYGLYAIVAGLLVLAGLDSAALAALSHNVNGAVAVIGAISAPVVAVVSAYFGMKVGVRSGSARASAADKARREAETEVKSLLGHMTPDRAIPVMRKLGVPVVDEAPSKAAA